MATITSKGSTISTNGFLPSIGSTLPDCKIVKSDLTELSMKDLKGKRLILNIFPSIDTNVCALSVRRFNQEAASLKNTLVLCISMDLPFALKRFCGAEGLEQVITASDFRYGSFGTVYGVRIECGSLAGLLSRAIVVADEKGIVLHTEQVPDIGCEPNYQAALEACAS
jgi:thioredoxin-dependent peroxiredoxin